MNDRSTITINNSETNLADGPIAADVDHEEFKRFLAEDEEPLSGLASSELSGEGIAFNSNDYATDEEAYAAMESFLMEALGASDEDA